MAKVLKREFGHQSIATLKTKIAVVLSVTLPPHASHLGVLGIKVKVMLDWDPKGVLGPKTPLPDVVIIHAPKEEDVSSAPAQVAAPAAFYQKHPSQP
ncbi:hypothetical protein F2Q70_00025325 [Brassica cretica]|uniref:Ribosomal protein S3 C-terminal domain-containing protein n=1 Tax=Brassica cretica TaxID=69181 RepID=A0A8S9L3H4_BRACR|nr:hypothetical protein F2Q70_00025325 [Brassica cretica]